ncbi:hypothetical protein LQZ19_18870 [Treponema primitia]|uniref:hypothetical protein n=1 Tax=Treponema primitia TaxID=88058 RepID=UPI00397FB62A
MATLLAKKWRFYRGIFNKSPLIFFKDTINGRILSTGLGIGIAIFIADTNAAFRNALMEQNLQYNAGQN